MACVTSLRLSPAAAAHVGALCVKYAGVETGGLLLGYRERDIIRVTAVTGPGPNALTESRRLELDASFVLGVLTGADPHGTRAVLGRWHKHLVPDLRASDDDRRGADAFRSILGCDTVELVVATDEEVPIGNAAYLCTSAGICRIATT